MQVNGIGTKKGEHKYSVTSCAIVNLPLQARLSFDYILLLSIVQSKLSKLKGGMAWVVSGLDEKGEQVVDDSLAAEMRELAAGILARPSSASRAVRAPLAALL